MLGFFISKKQQNQTLIEQKIKQNILDISNIKSLGENLIFNTSYSLLYEESIKSFLIILFKDQFNKIMPLPLNENNTKVEIFYKNEDISYSLKTNEGEISIKNLLFFLRNFKTNLAISNVTPPIMVKIFWKKIN
ncbi:hypothetical protein [Spiroplasma endosymbiont of Glossina fuscipes fuscipes]|uniref:hypothetical protein n=1 Tax=Spiroplasma endosymbiont of Glossina fuscipes fuscipes TaxID=2004463 RepID=UPI003C7286EA